MALNPLASCNSRTSLVLFRPTWIALAFVVFFLLPQARAETFMIDVAQRARLDPEQMVATLSKADVILIGEHHDNPPHHHIQANLIEALVKTGHRPVLLFEMLAERQEKRYKQYRQNTHTRSSTKNQQELDSVLEWSERGGPIPPAYQPLFTLAETYGLEIGHAGLPADLIRNILRYGVVAIPKSLRNQLFGALGTSDFLTLANHLSSVVAQARGINPDDPAGGGFIAAQIAKDAYMALRLSEFSRPVILIANADHVQTDIGVPIHLKKRGFTGQILSIGMLKKDREWLNSNMNGDAWNNAIAPFDWVWLEKTQEASQPSQEGRKN